MEAEHGRPLRILMMASEMVPFAKTGHVAEVISSLAKALAQLGHDVRVAIPRYAHVEPEQFGLDRLIEGLSVPMENHRDLATIYRTTVGSNVLVYMVDNPRYFGRNAVHLYVDEAERLIFHCRAILEMLQHEQVDWRPDIIHCHDWHTAIVPNWLATTYKDDPFFADTGTVFTVHRLTHQGIFGYRVLEVAGLESYGFIYYSGMADLTELVNLLGRGIYYADAITTVSESYAEQIQTAEFGEGLHPLLHGRSDSLFGVLNGIDGELYNPLTDSEIAANFGASSLDRRIDNKLALQEASGLQQDPNLPLIGMITRLNRDKGFDLLGSVLGYVLENSDAQFVILGVGEPKCQSVVEDYVQAYPGRMCLELTFNDALERKIYAGSDMFLMPSRVEPCGLGQMVAMRYGAVPVVRATGGLADTVQDYDPLHDTGTGFSFESYDKMALFAALIRAIEVNKHHDCWASLQRRCMSQDFSWKRSVSRYVEIYRWVLQRRRENGNAGSFASSQS